MPTFNLPDLHGSRTITGTNDVNGIGYKDVGGLPNITGEYLCETGVPGFATNAFFNTGSENRSVFAGAGWGQYMHFDASRSSNIYSSNNTEVQPKRIMMYYVIKYI